jgi:membrane protease YdiL (CAAX protease family)
VGQVLFFLAKLWLVVLPIAWRLGVERRPLSWSPPRKGGFAAGALLGLAIVALIGGAYAWLGPALLEPEAFRRMGAATGLARWPVYLTATLYWIGVNSVLEEMVWRWFVVERFESIGLGIWSAPASAAGFTLHHVVALRVYCDWPATLLCAAGIFIGAGLWSGLYLRTRSVWPGYLSHAIVDVAVFAIGWRLIRGG